MERLSSVLCFYIVLHCIPVNAEVLFVSPQGIDGGVFYCEEYENNGSYFLQKSGYLYRMTPVILTGKTSRVRNDHVYFESSNGAHGFIKKSNLKAHDFKCQLRADDHILVHIHHNDPTEVEIIGSGNTVISTRSVTIPMKLKKRMNGYYFVDAITADGHIVEGKIDEEGLNRLYKFVRLDKINIQLDTHWQDKLSANAINFFTNAFQAECSEVISRETSLWAEIGRFINAACSIKGENLIKERGVVLNNDSLPFLNNNIQAPRVFMCENNNPSRMVSLSAPDIGICFDSSQFDNNDFTKAYFRPFCTSSSDRDLPGLKMVKLSRPSTNAKDYFSAVSAVERKIRGDMQDSTLIDQKVYFILSNTIDFNMTD